MTDEKMIETLMTAQENLESIMGDFSLFRLDVLSSLGFLFVTIAMVIMSHKLLHLVKGNTGLTTLGVRGVVLVSWLLGFSAIWACLLTPYGMPFDTAAGAMITWFVLLALLFLVFFSPLIITFTVFTITVLPFIISNMKERQRFKSIAARGATWKHNSD